MAGFYPNLPGYKVVYKDGGLIITSPIINTESLLLIGTAIDGPKNIPVPIRKIEDAITIFGDVVDADGNPNGTNLMRAVQEAYDAGCRDIRVIRVNGQIASLTLLNGNNPKIVLKAIYPGELYHRIGIKVEVDTYKSTIIVNKPDIKGIDFQIDFDPTESTYNDVIRMINENRYNNVIIAYLADGANGDDLCVLNEIDETFLSGGADEIWDYKVDEDRQKLFDLLAFGDAETGYGLLELLENYDVDWIVIPDINLDDQEYFSTTEEMILGENPQKFSRYPIMGLDLRPVVKKGNNTLIENQDYDINYVEDTIRLLRNLREGTVTVTSDSPTVIGSGTSWSSLEWMLLGSKFKIVGEEEEYTISSVVSDTELRLTSNYEGNTGSGKRYTISCLVDVSYNYEANWGKLLGMHCYKKSASFDTLAVIGVKTSTPSTLKEIKNRVARLTASNSIMGRGFEHYNPKTKEKQDLGVFLSVVGGPDVTYINDRLGLYYCNGAVAYAALCTTLPPHEGPAFKQLPGVASLRFDYSPAQLNELTGMRYVTFRTIGGIVEVTDAPTAAKDIIEGVQKSDYWRLTTRRIAQHVIAQAKDAARPFLGKSFGLVQQNAFNGDFQRRLNAMIGTAIHSGTFLLEVTPEDSIKGEATLYIEIVPILELRTLNITIRLKPLQS